MKGYIVQVVSVGPNGTSHLAVNLPTLQPLRARFSAVRDAFVDDYLGWSFEKWIRTETARTSPT